MSIFNVEDEQIALAKMLVHTCKQHHFDGFVIEIWLNFGGKIKPARIITLVQRLGNQSIILLR